MLKSGKKMLPPNPNDLRKLPKFDLYLVLLHVIWLSLRRPALPRPVHFALVASLCMFALLPIMPHNIMAIPIVFGGGISFALILQGGKCHEAHR